ncbi:sensor histidine kinase [Marinifilum caeruleilacunae]|uniref:histidine kinase n=1 Tax=Marinifilum caeruleilacunae TaxID=2499076 RepID=A0ABX1WZW7_9BACT|nr:ABC transporter substrate binding protein [Marinifilum caeruleilacunae]NOU61713.1 PAS domain S-box protein [Marinifilum caeruleilacunae]
MNLLRKISLGILLVSVSIILCSFKTSARKKQVLVLHSYHQGLNWTDNVSAGILSVFDKHDDVEIIFEYMDTKRHSEAEYLAEFAKLYDLKHQKNLFDVIIVCDNNALDFARTYYQEYFNKIPIVFCGIDQFENKLIQGIDQITGVTEEIDSRKTIEIALELHPNTKQLVVINDNQTKSAILNRNNIRDFWSEIETNAKLIFLENLSIDELIFQVENLDSESIIYLINFSRDKEGNYISYQENIEIIREATDLPIYSSWEFYFNEGIVGGMITSGYKQGELSAKSALRILSGKNASQIPIIRRGYNQFKFDFEQMKRFKILPKQLPSGSFISNQPPSIIKQYQTSLVVIGIFIIVIVFILRYTTIKRERNERRLKKINEELDRRVAERTKEIIFANEKLELQTEQIVKQNRELEHHRHNLLELVKERTENLEHANEELKSSRDRLLHMLDSNSDGVWEHNFKTGKIFISKIIWDKLGYHSITAKDTRDLLCKLIHPEDLIIIKQKDKQNRMGKSEMFVIEFRICDKEKSWMWFKAKGKILDYAEDGSPLNMVGTLIDINQRKIAEEKIREEEQKLRVSEKRWRSLIEQASDEILIYNTDGTILDANSAACKWLGYKQSELLELNYSEIDMNHSSSELHSYRKKLSSSNPSISFESVQRRKDGSTFPVEIHLSLIELQDSKLILSVGTDISKRQETERKILNAVINTEESERKRFATDLHDSIGPLLSSINLYLSSLGKVKTDNDKENIITASLDAVNEALVSIKEISNNLSPHILNDFGLEKAIQSFTNKINVSQAINISFYAENMNVRLNHQVEVVIFRVVTELINNTIKHAKATNIEINLALEGNLLSLIYIDDGIGFDSKKINAGTSSGMGLYNVLSRIRSLNGTHKIKSNPERGGMMAVVEINL